MSNQASEEKKKPFQGATTTTTWFPRMIIHVAFLAGELGEVVSSALLAKLVLAGDTFTRSRIHRGRRRASLVPRVFNHGFILWLAHTRSDEGGVSREAAYADVSPAGPAIRPQPHRVLEPELDRNDTT